MSDHWQERELEKARNSSDRTVQTEFDVGLGVILCTGIFWGAVYEIVKLVIA